MKNILLTGLLLSSVATANTLKLTLDDAINLTLERNEDIAITKEEIKKSELFIEQVKSNLYPTITLEGKLQKFNQTASSPSPTIKNWQQIGNITLTQPVYTFGKISGAIKLANTQEKLIDNKAEASIADIKANAKTLFYNVLFFKMNYEAAKDSYKNTLENDKALKKRIGSGRISQNDNLKMRADIASREPNLIEAEKLYNASILDLKNFLALDENTTLEVLGKLEDGLFTKKVADVDLNSLVSVRLLEDSLKMQEANEDIYKSNFYPTLAFFASYNDTGIYKDFSSNHQRSQEDIVFGLNLSMSFELGGEKFKAHQIEKVSTRIKQLELQKGKRDVSTAIENLKFQYENSFPQIESIKRALELAENSYKVSLNSFSNGNISQTQLNDSELLLTNTKVNLARTLLMTQILKIKLEQLQTQAVN